MHSGLLSRLFEQILSRVVQEEAESLRAYAASASVYDSFTSAIDAALMSPAERATILSAVKRLVNQSSQQCPTFPPSLSVSVAHTRWQADINRQQLLEAELNERKARVSSKKEVHSQLVESLKSRASADSGDEFVKINRRHMRMLSDLMFCIDECNRDKFH